MTPLYMSPSEAAKRYELARSTVYELIAMPEAPATLKVGQRRLIPISPMDKFMSTFTEVKTLCSI